MATILKPEDKNQPGSNVPQMGANAPQQAAPQATPQKKGSGQFTNIQSYLNANKGAGQRVAQGVTGQVQKTLDPAKTQTQQYNDQVRQGIQSAQNTLQQGQGQLGQLQQIGTNIQGNTGGQFYNQGADLGIESFKNDPNFNQFQRIQQGQGVNEDQLNIQQQAFANQANRFNQLAEEQSGLAGTEGGRFDLLKRTFGGNVNPKYTSGQQRLDQLFLARQGLGDLKQNLQQNVNQSKDFQAQTQQTGQGTRLAQEQERSLMGNIDTQAKANEDAYLKMLESYVPEVNKRRDQEFTDLASRYGAMKTPGQQQAGGLLDKKAFQKATPGEQQAAAAQGLSADDLKLLGMTKNSQVFDVFNKTGLSDVADKGRQAAGYKDVARDTDVSNYGALADIARIDQGNRRLNQAGDLGSAVLAKQGAANLQNRLDEAAKTFYGNTAADKGFKEHKQYDSDVWSTVFGDPRMADKGVNLKQILSGQDLWGADRKAGGDPQKQAQKVYNDALNYLKQSGAGRVLTTEGQTQDALSGVKSDINKYAGNQGGWQKGQLHKFGTNLDETFLKNLQALGIEDPYKQTRGQAAAAPKSNASSGGKLNLQDLLKRSGG